MYDQDQDLDLFEMANLYPATTGLPMTVWVSPRGHARHDARVKVNMAHGPSMDASNTAVVGIRPVPSLIIGSLSAADKQAVFGWIERNTAALMDFWDGKIDTIQLGHLLIR
jgi:hypothetical protein